MRTKAYIFDYGGTLDTNGCHWGRKIGHAYVRNQVPVTEEQFREAYVYAERTLGKNPIIQTDYTFYKTLSAKLRIEMEWLVENGAWKATPKEVTEKHQAVLDDLYREVKETTAHSISVLKKLKPRYPMALVSNFYGNIPVVLHEFGFDGLFDAVIESAVVGIRKPDHRIFTLGVEALGLPPADITVVGDSMAKDIIPAIKAGCRTIWFKGEGWTDETFDESIPDKVITDLSQIDE